MRKTLAVFVVLILPTAGLAQEEPNRVSDVVQRARESVVVVSAGNREGENDALGTGFVIDAAGLIATGLHVTGEARPIEIELHDGTRHEVTEVLASDHRLDLVVVRIEPNRELKALELADDALADGQTVVAIGHPFGLQNSVVTGILAGEREIDSVRMLQLAMTIEPGNSGSPLLDLDSRVHGVVLRKQIGPKAFGFAVKVAELKKLLKAPNPIPIEQWKTIGQVDSNRWQPKMGARWRQRSGRLLVEGSGTGFGGRSLLLRVDEKPAVPFELSTMVKLDDESGAAGLLFHSDGEDKHYGFYPSAGQLRLTSFEGPNVFTWNIIKQIETEAYDPGAWNELRVRVEKDRIIGYVNGQAVADAKNVRLPPGQIGLASFRGTQAEFKHFRFGKSVPSNAVPAERMAELRKQLDALSPRSDLLDIDLIGHVDDLPQRMTLLAEQARDLEKRADELRKLSQDLHVAAVCDALRELVDVDEDSEIDLFRGAMLIAKLDNPEVDVEAYVESADGIAETIRKRFRADQGEAERLSLLDEYLFKQNGFHGSRIDYYNAANSHLDRVIDDREGLPVTLSVLYMSLAKKLGLNVVGVGLPGHFVVRHQPQKGEVQLIDVFDGGTRIGQSDANVIVLKATGRMPTEDDFKASGHRQILIRMLRNLLVLVPKDAPEIALPYAEAMAALEPDDPQTRGMRAVYRHGAGRTRAAVDDLDWILERKPEGLDLNVIRRMRAAFAR